LIFAAQLLTGSVAMQLRRGDRFTPDMCIDHFWL